MKLAHHLFCRGFVAAIIVGFGLNESRSQGATGFSIRRIITGVDAEPRVEVSWSTAPRTALLEHSPDFGNEAAWEPVQIVPSLQGGRFRVEIPTDSASDFYRLGMATVIFVDSANEAAGSGTFFDPFQSLALGLAEARIRFNDSGDAQTLYVFSKDYAETIEVNGPPGMKLSVLSSRVPLTLGSQAFGGDSRARLVAPMGQVAVNVSNCAGFRLTGFEITSSGATGILAGNIGEFAISDCTVTSSGGDYGVRMADIRQGNVTFEKITTFGTVGSGVSIQNYEGQFDVTDGDDENSDDDVAHVTGTQPGAPGIEIRSSSRGTFTFANINVENVGAEGVRLNDAGRVGLSGRNADPTREIGVTLISGTNGDAIQSTNTDLYVTFARIGESGQIMGDGIEINNTDGRDRTADLVFNNVFGLGVPDPSGRGVSINAQSGTLTANLIANFFSTEQSTIATTDGGSPNSLILKLEGNSTLSTDSAMPVMSIVGGGLHSTVVNSWDGPNQVIGGITGSSGILFERVTFDADGDPSTGIQQVVFTGELDIGQVPPFTIQRVEGNGLSIINAAGNLRIDTLNIANQNGTGLFVDGPFALDLGEANIETIGGVPSNIDL